METHTNAFGEVVTKWENNIHPDNPNYMQKVLWTMYEKQDGGISLCYRLEYNGKPKFIYGYLKEEILLKFGKNDPQNNIH